MVADGKAAMYIMGDWAKAMFKAAGKPYGNSAYLTIPEAGTDQVFLNNTDVFAFIRTTDKMISAQQALATTIMNPLVQHDFNILKGSIPARHRIDRKVLEHEHAGQGCGGGIRLHRGARAVVAQPLHIYSNQG